MERKRHASGILSDRQITAPYNFVPLPESVLVTEGAPPPHDRFCEGSFSGEIEYEATCLTPVYVREAPRIDQAGEADRKSRNVSSLQGRAEGSEFFHQGNPAAPCLPGSTVRGAMRSLVNLLSASKLPQCKDRRLFFRSFAGAMAEVYTKRMSDNQGKVQGTEGVRQAFRARTKAGFLRQGQGGYFIVPCYELRIARKKLPIGPDELYLTSRQGDRVKVPNPRFQHREVWVTVPRLDRNKKVPELQPDWRFHGARGGNGMYTWRRDVEKIQFQRPAQDAGWHSGYLVITGDVPKKAAEFVFVENKDARPVAVPEDVMRDAQDQDQISYWQERAFPEDDGRFVCAGPAGLPVWFLQDERGNITAIGRAQNFRLRYEHRTKEFVPTLAAAESLDFTERLFGRVLHTKEADLRGKHAQVRGRVRFHDARCETATPFLGPLRPGTQDHGYRVPQILAGPKPTAFQMYLNQPNPDERSLMHYSSDPGEIRGTKFYWHRNREDHMGKRVPLSEMVMFKPTLETGSQDSIIHPVGAGTRFQGVVRFDNLSQEELGALLAAIELPAELAHRLGMGKPLGLGSLRFRARAVRLCDRKSRYRSWSADPLPPAAPEVLENARTAFSKMVVEHHNHQDLSSPPVAEDATCWDVPRGATLATLLSWEGAPPPERTRQVGLAKPDDLLWRRRHVLPAPHEVAGKPDPWRGATERPRRASNAPALSGGAERAPAVNLLGTQVVRLLRPIAPNIWLGLHPDTGTELPVRRVRPAAQPRAGAAAQIFVSLENGTWVGSFISLSQLPDPDAGPHDERALAVITGGEPGQWEAQLVGGKRRWRLRGTPPSEVQVQVGAKVRVRIVRRDDEYLLFAQERS